MPRDDLSIDFVKKMPPVEAMDPALLLDEWLNRAQNLPEEIRFLQEEIAEKDRQYNQCIKEIEDRDGRIQKFIKANGSHAENPKEVEWRATIVKNYDTAERLAQEKVTLANKMQHTMDKHLRHLDMQMKLLYDRNEPGFNDPDEVPSLVRESAANITKPPTLNPFPSTLNNTAAAPATSAAPQAVSIRASHPQLKTNTQHAASAPATPAASMILGRQARESSAGPSGAPKRGPRAGLALGNLPTSGLARHSSLGPGTPKSQHQTATGAQRAGSAGPRANTKGTAGPGRKASTPSGSFVRKKSMPAGGAAGGGAGGAAGNKSGLSRVKRTAKNSPSSTADSELSDAEDLSGEDSGTSRRATPAARSSSHPNNGNGSGGANKEGSNDRDAASGPSGSNRKEGGASGPGGNAGGNGHSTGGTQLGRVRTAAADSDDDDDDAMDVDEDEAGDDKKYCLCQNVSFGDMVACDNEDCPYEWFHWGCVGLKSEPNGAWFCPQCTEDRKKKG